MLLLLIVLCDEPVELSLELLVLLLNLGLPDPINETMPALCTFFELLLRPHPLVTSPRIPWLLHLVIFVKIRRQRHVRDK